MGLHFATLGQNVYLVAACAVGGAVFVWVLSGLWRQFVRDGGPVVGSMRALVPALTCAIGLGTIAGALWPAVLPVAIGWWLIGQRRGRSARFVSLGRQQR